MAFLCKFPAANLTLVCGVRMLRSAALSMRRVVVSAESGVVAEPHVADLTLDANGRCLKSRNDIVEELMQHRYCCCYSEQPNSPMFIVAQIS